MLIHIRSIVLLVDLFRSVLPVSVESSPHSFIHHHNTDFKREVAIQLEVLQIARGKSGF